MPHFTTKDQATSWVFIFLTLGKQFVQVWSTLLYIKFISFLKHHCISLLYVPKSLRFPHSKQQFTESHLSFTNLP